MQNKSNLKFYLGIVFLSIGCWKLYEQYIVGKELSTIQLVGSFFLVALGLYRIFEYVNNRNKPLDS